MENQTKEALTPVIKQSINHQFSNVCQERKETKKSSNLEE